MNKSLYKSLTIVREKTRSMPKTKAGYGYRYTPLDQILDYLRPILSEAGLVVAQTIGNEPDGRTAVETIVATEDGAELKFRAVAPIAEVAPGGKGQKITQIQQMGSEITYLRRYSILAALGLASDEDLDGAAAKNWTEPRPDPAAEKRARREQMLTDRARELGRALPDLRTLPDSRLVELWAELCAPTPVAPAPVAPPKPVPTEPPKVEEKVKPETKQKPEKKEVVK